MTFAYPALLWSLAAILPLVAIYFLKVRPRKRPTTALFLWRQVVQQRQSQRLFHRLRDLWSLLLMALAFAAIALALAAPRWTAVERKDLLLVIDTSASMQATSGRTTRLEEAKRRAMDIITALDGVQRAAVATLGQTLEYRSQLTDNPRALLAAIEAIEPTDETLQLAALPAAGTHTANAAPESKPASPAVAEITPSVDAPPPVEALAAPAWNETFRVLLISDGGFESDALPAAVELVQVGTPVENLGIVAADLGFFPSDSQRLTFYVQLASTAEEPRDVDLLLSQERDGRFTLVKVIPLHVTPGKNPPQVYYIEDGTPGRWVAEIEIADALTSDNKAYLVARKTPPIRTAIAAENRFFFEQSVLAFSQESDLLQLVDQDPLVTVAAGEPPAAGKLIVFAPKGDSPWWSDLGAEIDVAAPRLLIDGHPLLEHIDPTTINFAGARKLRLPAGSQVLVASEDDVPLIYLASRAGESAVVVNLDPVAAEFFFSAWFPVLVRSAALHLADRQTPLAATYAPGAHLDLPGARNETMVQTLRPDGRTDESRGGRFRGLRDLGFYECRLPGADWTLACSQLAPSETLLNAAERGDTAAPIASGALPSSQLTILALLLIVGESLLYHRRKVG